MMFFGMFALIVLAAIIAGGLAVVVFACALPFLLRRDKRVNRFGVMSSTRSPSHAVVSGFSRAFDISGRSNRLDFWIFAVAVGITCVLITASVVFLLLARHGDPFWGSLWLLLIFPALAIPCLTVAVRRLHDVNKSRWWLLLLLVCGYFILLYWFCQPSQTGADPAEVFN